MSSKLNGSYCEFVYGQSETNSTSSSDFEPTSSSAARLIRQTQRAKLMVSLIHSVCTTKN